MRNIGINAGSFGGLDPREDAEFIKAAGFSGVFTGFRGREVVLQLADILADVGLTYETIHAPFRGINAIWNFAAVSLEVPESVVCQQENLALLYCPADTDLSVHYELYVSEDLMTIQIGVDRELVCFDSSMRDVITFTEDSVEYSDVEKISFENLNGTAMITILLKKPPAKLITNVYVNAGRSNDILCRIGQWGTIMCPPGTLTIDTTVYRRMNLQEQIGITSTGHNLRYSPIVDRRCSLKEKVSLTSSLLSLRYSKVGNILYEAKTESVSLGLLTNGIEYKQTGASPV